MQILVQGYYGVVIFFAISGFLITRNTLRRYGQPDRFPIACFLSGRTTVLVGIMIALIGYAPFVRTEYQGLFSCWGTADVLSFGCLAAIVEHRHGGRLDRISVMTLLVGSSIAVAGLMLFTAPRPDAAWAISLIGLCVAVFLFAAVSLPATSPHRIFAPLVGLLARFGAASYEIYLFHSALIIFYHHALDRAPPRWRCLPIRPPSPASWTRPHCWRRCWHLARCCPAGSASRRCARSAPFMRRRPRALRGGRSDPYRLAWRSLQRANELLTSCGAVGRNLLAIARHPA